ncbi:hypothetical protein KCX83_09990, partial [Brucella oryzae]|nr:hypothetical protein [Brucella oryzae]
RRSQARAKVADFCSAPWPVFTPPLTPCGVCENREEVVTLVKRMFEELWRRKQLEFNRPFMWNDGKCWYK